MLLAYVHMVPGIGRKQEHGRRFASGFHDAQCQRTGMGRIVQQNHPRRSHVFGRVSVTTLGGAFHAHGLKAATKVK